MADYKEMYVKLFNGITDVIEDLKQLQLEAEERYILSEGEEQASEKEEDK